MGEMTCGEVEALLARAADGLEVEEARRLEAHLGECSACRVEEAAFEAVEEEWARPEMRHDRAETVFAGVEAALRSRPDEEGLPEILTMDEVAGLLRVSREELEAELETLPVFEFAGRLRIRRSRLMEWIEAREKLVRCRVYRVVER